MKTAIINWENAHENDLVRETMEACKIDDVSELFEGDPDELRINGETVSFIDIQNPEHTRQTVIYLDGSYQVDEKEIVKRLTEFYSVDENGADTFNLYYNNIESTDENMRNLKNGIAYRGGQGYTYSLYGFKN
ncbi:MAG: hypothetical protein LBL58_13840 [Tannerellaceae bacterium]|jgi:hypothetical protein|nr:hypothetical protein [Tannerellaceae bacterium]